MDSPLPSTSVEIEVQAPPEVVWPHFADLELLASASTEFESGEWIEGEPTEVGARFQGNQRIGEFTWTTISEIHVSQPGGAFGWTVGDLDDPVAIWDFAITPGPGGSRLTYSCALGTTDQSGLMMMVAADPDNSDKIIDGRLSTLRENMQRTIELIRDRAEG